MADLLQLPAALERWGLTVVAVTGWEDRKRPGAFAPIGVMIHHTAAPDRSKDAPSLQVCIDGRRDLPGPLCQLLVARSGKVYVISAGRCNHAGEGSLPAVPANGGNTLLVGIEAENDGVGELWPAVQVGAMVRATAAVLDLLGRPRMNVWGHREYTPRKIDPAGIAMAQFRADVAAARPPGDTPMPTLPENDPGARIQRAINANGLQPPLKIDGQVGPVTADGLDTVLRWLNGQMADLRKANATSADSIKRLTAKQAELLEAAAASDALIERVTMARENAEAEALQLRRQLQEGGRIGQLLADLDAAVEMIDLAIGRARA